MHIFNEVVTLFLFYWFLCQSDFVADATRKYQVGYVCNFFAMMHLAIMISLDVYDTYRRLYYCLKRMYILKKNKIALELIKLLKR
jgi:hypothetical protein